MTMGSYYALHVQKIQAWEKYAGLNYKTKERDEKISIPIKEHDAFFLQKLAFFFLSITNKLFVGKTKKLQQ